METLVKKSAAAALMIALGDYVLLKIGAPLGAFLFAFGLLGVCALGANLFTGKAGAMQKNGFNIKDMLIILAVNLVVGYAIGFLMSLCDDDVKKAAISKVASWDFSSAFFVKAFFCGAIMYITVQSYKKTPLSVFIGVPLFILCGFQHCIANIITLGIANIWDWSILLAIGGNWAGAITISWLLDGLFEKKAALAVATAPVVKPEVAPEKPAEPTPEKPKKAKAKKTKKKEKDGTI